ncbi:hypothetical protein, partial [Hylemonella gracilis]|uniref:hypothetical protein n=1 Tax=Hylemonella gracilis TaxID=80880 RepID=UPI001ED8ED61
MEKQPKNPVSPCINPLDMPPELKNKKGWHRFRCQPWKAGQESLPMPKLPPQLLLQQLQHALRNLVGLGD